jgi:hypothetical protein
MMSNPSSTPAADGSFSLVTVKDGNFRVTMPRLPPGFYLKQATLDDVDVLNTPSRFSVRGNLEVVISGKAAQVDGLVTDDQSRPVAGIEAVLIPDTARNRTELFKRTVTDREGRFSIPDITPGDYRVFAWEDLEANSFFDPEVLKRFEQKGTPIRVGESLRQTVEVKRIPAGAEQ